MLPHAELREIHAGKQVTSLILGLRTLLNAINIKGIDNFIFLYFNYDLKIKHVRMIKNIVDETVTLIIKWFYAKKNWYVFGTMLFNLKQKHSHSRNVHYFWYMTLGCQFFISSFSSMTWNLSLNESPSKRVKYSYTFSCH